MVDLEIVIGAISFVAFYFFMAGVVAEHSSSNAYKDISSPLPAIVRGIFWPLLLVKFLLLMIWRDEF